MTRTINGQVLFAFALLGLNTVYASQVLAMDLPFANGEPGPAFLPMMLCAFVFIAMIRILMTELRAKPAERAAAMTSDHIRNLHVLGPLGAIALISLFIVVFVYAGYLPAAALYTFAIALFFNYESSGDLKKAALMALGISAVITTLCWLFFVKLFDLYLPMWEL